MVRKTVLLTVALVVLAATVGAQSLMDDPQYRSLIEEVQALKAQAQTAIDEGHYDEAVELSREAEELADEASQYADQRVRAFQANSWVRRAQQRIRYAESINAETEYPQEWETANQHMVDAQASFQAEEWTEAIAAARLVVDTLEGLQPVRVSQPEPEPEPEPQPEPEDQGTTEPTLPRYYVVRLIPERRDCFWRIAEYDFVYGDPWEWTRLYEANRDKLPDPDNPHLILPGMIVEIPSINGEDRAGTWNPEDRPEVD